MAAPSPLAEHDAVALLQSTAGWPVGTIGAIVSLYDGAALVEIVDAGGRTRDLVTLRLGQLIRSAS